ncbi:endo-1,3-1,4-beta-glycanase ExoK [soil metagenome]
MAVWSEHPKNSGEEARLARVAQEAAFKVSGLREDFDSVDEDRWNTPSKEIGRGRLDPENVSVERGKLRLKIPSGTFAGGEIQSRKLYLYGSYLARIKVANSPSSITGFFLYREPDLENELDIEIFNEPTGHILFTTYSTGGETNNVRKKLPFDPTKNFHEYRFDFYPGRADFYADDDLLHSFDEGLPEEPMNLYVNAWFPTWLSGQKPETDSYTYVDWIRH